jgi:Uma2 family endonuclease
MHLHRAPALPKAARSHAGFRAWVTSPTFPEHVRPTFLGGDVWLDVSPESIETHNKVKLEFTSVLARLVRDRELGEAFADRAFFSNPGARVSTEPDFMFVSWASFRSKRVTLTRRKERQDEFIEIVGVPDLILEVVSDGSTRKDFSRLKEAYARARIPEYWLIDARGDEIRFEILRCRAGTYVSAAPAFDPQVSRVLGARFTLRRTRNRLGRFAYRLAISAVPSRASRRK